LAILYLARHGETTWNLAGRYQGRLESDLSELGMRQGSALADYFVARSRRGEPVPSRAIASPLVRCTATAAFVTSRLGIPLETDARLIEIAHGTWEGRYRDEIAANDAERYRLWRQDPARVAFENGETLGEVRQRWRAFATRLADENDDLLVVTHDAVVRCALLDVMGRPLDELWSPRVENGGFARIENDGGALRVVDECVVSHLTGLRSPLAGQAL
jgi:broad specificity phosphatase PhoE